LSAILQIAPSGRAAIRQFGCTGLHGPLERRIELRPAGASERIERAALIKALDRGPVALRWIDAAREIKQAPERPPVRRAASIARAAWPPQL